MFDILKVIYLWILAWYNFINRLIFVAEMYILLLAILVTNNFLY